MSVAAILLCAGKGTRLDAGVDKALAPLAGRPLFAWSLEALERSPAIEHIVVVGPVKRMKDALAAAGLAPLKVVAWGEGGRERQDSVARGLQALPEACATVAIHDSARALITPELIARVVGDAIQHGAAIAAMPLSDTLKRGALETIETTVPRQGLWCAQTPQVFRRDWIVAAHAAASRQATDDAALVEAIGHRVHLTTGDPLNFKITTPQDLELAEAWLTRASARQT
ncbi:MAG TPA: 2-C-methyl-D-erythritol 4-phosphate cytidylyltransferase [Candidatus Eisenbacteria bacterium]|nr:2-C-methyl-D-erythritol 4-phosphate cytidylyltransferase [Candidatus Eisenbacteria bacterium]